MPAIIDSGAAYIAAHIGAGEPVAITQFVLAQVPGLDDTQPVPLDATLPAAENIVYEAAVSRSAYVTPDQVVYSLVLDTRVGDFEFNWLGLQAADGTLVAVAYVPLTPKTATSGGVQGNNITRNFLLQFTDAQMATGIEVPAETWQIDVSAVLTEMDERERESNADLYGPAAFFKAGWQLQKTAESSDAAYQLSPGIGYVGGLRSIATEAVAVDAGTLPTDISLDVHLQRGLDGAQVQVAVVRGTPKNYTDSAGQAHYIVRVAHVTVSGTVEDKRPVLDIGDDGVIQTLLRPATETRRGTVERATKAEVLEGADDSRYVSPKQLWAALNHLIPLNVGVFWHGTIDDIPDGWALADGKDGRPDAINRVLICAGEEYKPGDKGGQDKRNTDAGGSHSHNAKSGSGGTHTHEASSGSAGEHAHVVQVYNHTLSLSASPPHAHSTGSHPIGSRAGAGLAAPSWSSTRSSTANAGGGGAHNHGANSLSAGAHAHSVTVAEDGSHSHAVTVETGGSHSHNLDTRQRYYAAAHIVRIA